MRDVFTDLGLRSERDRCAVVMEAVSAGYGQRDLSAIAELLRQP